MGCSDSKSQQELFLNELWDSTTISQTTPIDYLTRMKSLVEILKKREKE